MTILDAIIQSLGRAGEYNRDDQIPPAVILWPDKEHQWEPLLPVLRERLPQLLTLGPYAANSKTGPAIWMRCMIARTLPEAKWPEKTVPILYLPGVSRQELRAVAECPPPLMPLAELQYRGAFWSQVNHKDWTVLAFMQSAEGGLSLDVSRDTATLDAIKTALVKLAETDIQDLVGHRLEASDFHALLSPDPVREILAWINDPKAVQAKMSAEQWDAFCHSCKDKFNLHPAKDGPLRAAELMGLRQGNWTQVWNRFREAPRRYPNLPVWLRKAKPQDDDLFLKESDEVWPQSNEIHETALRNTLKACDGKPAPWAIQKVRELEKFHAKRRDWVWVELGQAPLAFALKHLALLSETCAKPVAGGALDDLVSGHLDSGWCADAAVIDALAVVEKKEDIEAVQAVIRAVYAPWLESCATAFQKLAKPNCSTIQSKAPAGVSDIAKGTVIVFADGLRFDLAHKLKLRLADRGVQIELAWRWTALPTVTPTAKPAVSPITNLFAGDETCEEFKPKVKEAGKDLTSDRFKRKRQ
jgi:hypothetical protein